MSSASNGRKNRPRSAGNIFQIGKPPYRDPQRRESTESTRKAQRAVADCRMVGLRHVNACMVPLIRSAVLLSKPFFVLGRSTIPCTQDAQTTAVNSCRKKKSVSWIFALRVGSWRLIVVITFYDLISLIFSFLTADYLKDNYAEQWQAVMLTWIKPNKVGLCVFNTLLNCHWHLLSFSATNWKRKKKSEWKNTFYA